MVVLGIVLIPFPGPGPAILAIAFVWVSVRLSFGIDLIGVVRGWLLDG